MKERISIDLKNAMKNQNKELLNVIRMLKGSIQLEEIKQKRDLTDEEIINIVSKEIKSRKDSIKDFERGSRQDLVDKTNKEVEILLKYMPTQLTEEEINKIIEDTFNEVKPISSQDIGKIMAKVTPLLKGKADLSSVSTIIKEKLANL
ncbi:MAG: GatB/YqeY domain-containing protein [Clostridium sp.]|nr:GatB/YqeY domain-containing protein [Clostridium sp.]MCM1444695.1 GatB/YqeY domain-containing protein [Candidatus Amulumruptor caecigallinarius]